MQFSSDAMLRKPLLCCAFALIGIPSPRLRLAILVSASRFIAVAAHFLAVLLWAQHLLF